VTKGPGSKAAGLAMAFKLLEAAQDRWRAVNGPHLVALVRAGARFDKGLMIERPDEVQGGRRVIMPAPAIHNFLTIPHLGSEDARVTQPIASTLYESGIA
jgi:hypothetical protein